MAFKWDATKWSFYDQCPFKYAAKWVWKFPEAPASEAILKGRRGHVAVENMILHGAEDVYGVHPKALPAIQHVIAQEDKLIESKLTFSRAWEMVPNKHSDVWLTIKMDVVYRATFLEPDAVTRVHVIDWKTGKTKAAAYKDQLDLYRLTAATAFPADRYLASIVNVDDGKITEDEQGRAEVLQSRDKWIERATMMETDSKFEPKPNAFCSWCPFANSRGGRCRYG